MQAVSLTMGKVVMVYLAITDIHWVLFFMQPTGQAMNRDTAKGNQQHTRLQGLALQDHALDVTGCQLHHAH